MVKRFKPNSIYNILDTDYKKMGIYGIRNTKTKQIYIGSTTLGFVKRWNVHVYQLFNNKHGNIKLQRSWNKYGGENFEFYIIELVSVKENCIKREQHYLDTTNPYYNINITAGSTLGMKLSASARKKISDRHKGVKKSPEHIEKVRQAHLGKFKAVPWLNKIAINKRKPIMALFWKEKTYKVFSHIGEATQELNIIKQTIMGSRKFNYLLNFNILFIDPKNFDVNKPFEEHFNCYKFDNKYFLSLKELAKFMNKSETTAFRKIQKGEVIPYGRS